VLGDAAAIGFEFLRITAFAQILHTSQHPYYALWGWRYLKAF
jgi:hypothetical protein